MVYREEVVLFVVLSGRLPVVPVVPSIRPPLFMVPSVPLLFKPLVPVVAVVAELSVPVVGLAVVLSVVPLGLVLPVVVEAVPDCVWAPLPAMLPEVLSFLLFRLQAAAMHI